MTVETTPTARALDPRRAETQRLGGVLALLGPMPTLRLDPAALRRDWSRWVLLAGAGLLALPTLVSNAQRSWATEQGEHGPIVLAIGLWLLWRRWPAMRAVARPGSAWLALALGAPLATLFLLARVADEIRVECYALYALGLTALYALMGWRSLVKGSFPLVYLALALPTPAGLTWQLTYRLRIGVTEAATGLCQLLGWSVARDGLEIVVDNYRLAVKAACSGMNSLISLSAIGLIYVYIRRSPPWGYLAAMMPAIIGFAVLGNFVRVMVLISLTHFFGDAVAQSYLHETAGLVTFSIALLGVIGLDAVLAPRVLRHEAAGAAA